MTLTGETLKCSRGKRFGFHDRYRYFVDLGFFLKREQPAFVDIGTKNPGGASYQRISEEAGFLESTNYR